MSLRSKDENLKIVQDKLDIVLQYHVLNGLVASSALWQNATAGDDARLAIIAGVLEDLGQSYNKYLIEKWFKAPRLNLGGHSPLSIFAGTWDANTPGVSGIIKAAAESRPAPQTGNDKGCKNGGACGGPGCAPA